VVSIQTTSILPTTRTFLIVHCEGINQHTVREIMQLVEPKEIHLSALKTVKGGMSYRNTQASMSSDGSNEQEYNVDIADTEKINAVIKALEQL
jgi:copper homeostasis protein CutC